jgi:hypothetical protein
MYEVVDKNNFQLFASAISIRKYSHALPFYLLIFVLCYVVEELRPLIQFKIQFLSFVKYMANLLFMKLYK